MYCFPTHQHVGENRYQVCEVIDRDGRAEEGVEGGGGAEIKTSEDRDYGCDGKLGVKGDKEGGMHFSPAERLSVEGSERRTSDITWKRREGRRLARRPRRYVQCLS